jgi:hypothetical protein
LAKVSVVKHESHFRRVLRDRESRDGGAGKVALVGCLEQRPLANILGEHAFHDAGELGHDLGVQFWIVNSPVGRADGN